MSYFFKGILLADINTQKVAYITITCNGRYNFYHFRTGKNDQTQYAISYGLA
jgi:hypothetical protein